MFWSIIHALLFLAGSLVGIVISWVFFVVGYNSGEKDMRSALISKYDLPIKQ